MILYSSYFVLHTVYFIWQVFESLQREPGKISISGFHSLLLSHANSAVDPKPLRTVTHDMTQPLAHYLAYVTAARAGFPGAFRAEEDTQQSPQNAQCLQTCP